MYEKEISSIKTIVYNAIFQGHHCKAFHNDAIITTAIYSLRLCAGTLIFSPVKIYA